MSSIKDIIHRLDVMKRRIKNIPDSVSRVVNKNKEVLLSLNRDQMLLGRNAKGEVLTPSYLNDSYFDNYLQAQMYAAMKYSLESWHKERIENPTLYPDKGRNTPNLIVTGPFQDNMFIITNGDKFIIGSTFMESNDIEEKYKNLVFGISPESKQFFWEHYLLPELQKSLNRQLR